MNYDHTLRGHLRYFLRDAKLRAKRHSVPLDIDLDYLESIVVYKCPIFNTPFIFGLGSRGLSGESPSLDRIIPSKGYVRGNVAFISHRANTIKHNVEDAADLLKVAAWLQSQ